MPTSYRRCGYTHPNGLECESWFPVQDEYTQEQFCPVHRGMVSISLAANGHNKDEFIDRSQVAVAPLIEQIKGMSDQEALSFLDAHIAKIEQEIENKKIEAMATSALRRSKEEKLSDAEREERRKIKTARPVKEKKENKAGEIGKAMKEREKTIASIIKAREIQGVKTSREEAIKLMEG